MSFGKNLLIIALPFLAIAYQSSAAPVCSSIYLPKSVNAYKANEATTGPISQLFQEHTLMKKSTTDEQEFRRWESGVYYPQLESQLQKMGLQVEKSFGGYSKGWVIKPIGNSPLANLSKGLQKIRVRLVVDLRGPRC